VRQTSSALRSLRLLVWLSDARNRSFKSEISSRKIHLLYSRDGTRIERSNNLKNSGNSVLPIPLYCMKASVATGQRSKGDASYDPVRIGKPQTPYLIRGLEATFDVLFALVLGKGTDLLLETEKHEPRSMTFVNKFSGKALEVENSSVHQGGTCQVRLRGARRPHRRQTTSPRSPDPPRHVRR
jgi:hypothetical protein